jgi:hypothetical protein
MTPLSEALVGVEHLTLLGRHGVPLAGLGEGYERR